MRPRCSSSVQLLQGEDGWYGAIQVTTWESVSMEVGEAWRSARAGFIHEGADLQASAKASAASTLVRSNSDAVYVQLSRLPPTRLIGQLQLLWVAGTDAACTLASCKLAVTISRRVSGSEEHRSGQVSGCHPNHMYILTIHSDVLSS